MDQNVKTYPFAKKSGERKTFRRRNAGDRPEHPGKMIRRGKPELFRRLADIESLVFQQMDRLPDPAAVEQTKRRGRSRLFELVFQNTAAHAERSGDLFAGHRLTHVCGEKLFQTREKNIPLKDSPERIRQNLFRKSGQELPEKGFGKVPERNPAEDLFFRSPEMMYA